MYGRSRPDGETMNEVRNRQQLRPVTRTTVRAPAFPGWDRGQHRPGCRCTTCQGRSGSQYADPWMRVTPAAPASEFVRWVQSALGRALGSRLPITGVMDTGTRRAVRQFQRLSRLPEDGIVGPPTQNALVIITRRSPDRAQREQLEEISVVNVNSLLRWFPQRGNPPMQPVRPGNQVLPFITGRATFAQMVQAIRTATTGEHYIYLIGWILDDQLPMIPGQPGTTINRLFQNATNNGVQVRAMLWDQWGRDNSAQVKRINQLPDGAAILDNKTLRFGAHHQKILVVKGKEGLIAFCGGVDIHPTRINTGGGGGGSGSGGSGRAGGDGTPYHDVHCQITGPAAYDLLKIFNQRWMDHSDHTSLDRTKGALRGLREQPPATVGSSLVQIGRTFGNGAGYTFAPGGEQTIRRQVLHAIGRARKFIHLEDQYLVDPEISRALQKALPNIQHLTIVIPHSDLLSPDDCPDDFHAHRRKFIAPLRKVGGNKVRVFCPSPIGGPFTYVHAKMWVFDDELAIIGSANCNRRGYTHDSEVVAAIADPEKPVVRDLRVALWAKHLNLETPAGRAQLQDGVASGGLWVNRPSGARVTPFNENAAISVGSAFKCRLAPWGTFIDPDGS